MEPEQALLLRVTVHMRVMAIQGYSTFPKVLELELWGMWSNPDGEGGVLVV